MSDYDLIIIGSGPGGYVAGIRAGQLGLRAAVVEKEELGGVCLNWGCIPSKALIRNAEILNLVRGAGRMGISYDNLRFDFGAAVDRSRSVVKRLTSGVAGLLRRNGVDVINGAGALAGRNTVTVDGEPLSADNVIIATGARFRELPSLPLDGRVVMTSREALASRDVPETVVIVGGGATGAEFAYVYRSYGARVVIVEMLPRLAPAEDEEISAELGRAFQRQGIEVKTGSTVRGVSVRDGTANVTIDGRDGSEVIECDRVLVAVGSAGNVEGLGLESAGVRIERGFIPIDHRMMTNVPGVYAIGDVTGKLLLAHVASAQGVAAVEGIAGQSPQPLDYELMPRATYCHPQVASFGITEAQAVEWGHEVKVGRFPLAASGKALAMDEPQGMVKIVTDAELGEVLGVHMIGAEVTELLGEAVLGRHLEATTQEFGWAVHPHPTISEAVKEAALASNGRLYTYRRRGGVSYNRNGRRRALLPYAA